MSRRHAAILVLLAALWGASFLFMRIAAPVLGAVWLIELRVLLAGLVLLPVIVWRGELGAWRPHWRALLLVGALNAALPFTLFAYASIHLSAGLTSILNATVPIFSALFAGLVLRQTLGPLKVAGVVVGFCGVVVLMAWRDGGGGVVAGLPIAAGLAAAVSYVLAANYTKRRLGGISPLLYVTGSQLGAAVLLLPLLPLFPPLHTPDGIVIGSVIGLGVFSTALAFALYFHLIHQIGPVQTLTVTYLIPVFAILWGWWLLHETIGPIMLAGCVLILTGTALANGMRPARLLARVRGF